MPTVNPLLGVSTLTGIAPTSVGTKLALNPANKFSPIRLHRATDVSLLNLPVNPDSAVPTPGVTEVTEYALVQLNSENIATLNGDVEGIVGAVLNSAGTRLMVYNEINNIGHYLMDITGYDVSTAAFNDHTSTFGSGEDGSAGQMHIRHSNSVFYNVDNDGVYQNSWQGYTANMIVGGGGSIGQALSEIDSNGRGLSFSSDYLKMFVTTATHIYQYSLSVAGSITTKTFVKSIDTGMSDIKAIFWQNDKKLFVIDGYILKVITFFNSYDVSSIVSISNVYDFSGDGIDPGRSLYIHNNEYLYITHDDSGSFVEQYSLAITTTPLEGAAYPVKNNLLQTERKYLPALMRGFNHFFYANTSELLTDSDFALWLVALYDCDGNFVQSLGAPTKDIITSPGFRFYIDLAIESYVGTGFIVVYNSATSNVLFQSNAIRVIDPTQVRDYVLVEWRSTVNVDNHNYLLVDTEDKYNSVFLDMTLLEDDFEQEIKGVSQESDGLFRVQKNTRKRYLVLETQLFDKETHDLMSSINVHKNIRVNNEVVTIRKGYEKAKPRDSNLSNGSWELWVDADASAYYNT